MAKKSKIPRIQLYDPAACKLVMARAKKENRSKSNALMTTVLEALGHDTISEGVSQEVKPSFLDNVVEKGACGE